MDDDATANTGNSTSTDAAAASTANSSVSNAKALRSSNSAVLAANASANGAVGNAVASGLSAAAARKAQRAKNAAVKANGHSNPPSEDVTGDDEGTRDTSAETVDADAAIGGDAAPTQAVTGTCLTSWHHARLKFIGVKQTTSRCIALLL